MTDLFENRGQRDYAGSLQREQYFGLWNLLRDGETYFWRFSQIYEFITSYFKKVHEQEPKKTVRVLDCPCSVGLESLSIVACLLEAGFPLEQMQVIGLDIEKKLLDVAQKGVYWAKVDCKKGTPRVGLAFVDNPMLFGLDLDDRLLTRLLRIFNLTAKDFLGSGEFWIQASVQPEVLRVIKYDQGDIFRLASSLGRSQTSEPDFDLILSTHLPLSTKNYNVTHDQLVISLIEQQEQLLRPGGLLVTNHIKEGSSTLIESGLQRLHYTKEALYDYDVFRR